MDERCDFTWAEGDEEHQCSRPAGHDGEHDDDASYELPELEE